MRYRPAQIPRYLDATPVADQQEVTPASCNISLQPSAAALLSPAAYLNIAQYAANQTHNSAPFTPTCNFTSPAAATHPTPRPSRLGSSYALYQGYASPAHATTATFSTSTTITIQPQGHHPQQLPPLLAYTTTPQSTIHLQTAGTMTKKDWQYAHTLAYHQTVPQRVTTTTTPTTAHLPTTF